MSAFTILAENNQGISTEQTPNLVHEEIINFSKMTQALRC